MNRGRVAEIRDPAVAIAAGKCWMARWRKGGMFLITGVPINSFHPAPCGFCEYPPDKLAGALEEFVDWARLKAPRTMGETTELRAEIEMFQTLPKEEQQRLVERAQGYVPEPDEQEDDL